MTDPALINFSLIKFAPHRMILYTRLWAIFSVVISYPPPSDNTFLRWHELVLHFATAMYEVTIWISSYVLGPTQSPFVSFFESRCFKLKREFILIILILCGSRLLNNESEQFCHRCAVKWSSTPYWINGIFIIISPIKRCVANYESCFRVFMKARIVCKFNFLFQRSAHGSREFCRPESSCTDKACLVCFITANSLRLWTWIIYKVAEKKHMVELADLRSQKR